jgi:microcin C transport system substrate-binding protein
MRRFLFAACAAVVLVSPLSAQEQPQSEWKHGLSLMGEPQLPKDFPHFPYVNPTAPVGGSTRIGMQGGFDSFNMVIDGVKGDVENGIALIYDTLMTASLNEVSTEYGLLAESVRVMPDGSAVTYRLRSEARWHDGKPITADDVVFSFNAFKSHSPAHASYYKNVEKAEITGEREVTFTFSEKGNRELPQILGQLVVLPKHWWEGKDVSGKQRSITETTLEPPLGSGAYRLEKFDVGRSATYARVPNYWAKDLNVRRGHNNLAQLTFDYYRDTTVLLEAFKGDKLDFRRENSARNWATAYDFPAVREKRVIREEFPLRAQGTIQAFVPNLRKPLFQDARVRRALNLAFDYEDINKTLFYSQYERTRSYFQGTELAAGDSPSSAERALLEPLRAKYPDFVPASVFDSYINPVNGAADRVRENLRLANALLLEAGFERRGNKLVNAKTGEAAAFEILAYDSSLERFILPYKATLERLGFTVNVRVVDATQYQARLRTFDFDLITNVWGQSLSPGNEQRDYWGSAAATRNGSRNYAGIQNPAVDTLVESVVFAKDRPALITATRALDRVLLHNQYVIPQWTYGFERTARWDRYEHPTPMPQYGGSGFPTLWWSKAP